MKFSLIAIAVIAASAVVLAAPRFHRVNEGVKARSHEVRLAAIRAHNANPKKTWTAGFSPRPLSQRALGVNITQSKAKLREAVAAGRVKVEHKLDMIAIPDSFDAAEQWPMCKSMINNVRDQSNCGCCWAFGAAEAASDRLCIATKGKTLVPLSVEELCFCASSDGCSGGDLETPWDYIQNTGLSSGADQGNGTFDKGGFCSRFSLPHCHHHGPVRNDPYPPEGSSGCPSESSPQCPTSCDADSSSQYNNFGSDRWQFSGSVASFPDVPSIQQAIMQNGPVEVAFTVYSDFEDYVSGVYQHSYGDELGGHAVKITGWGVDNTTGTAYWKILNSWNPYWGENGFFRMIRGTDDCGIEDQATASSSDAVWSHM